MNYQINFDPNGGDLGRAKYQIDSLEFRTVLPHIAHILECLHVSSNSKLPYKYAFEFSSHSRKAVEWFMTEYKLPPHVKWYESDGLKIFAMRGASGGVVTGQVCYLVTGE